MFQSSGVAVWHYGDEEEQVIFDGRAVRPEEAVYLRRDGRNWQVVPETARYQNQDFFFEGDFVACADWVMKNYRQYRRFIYGKGSVKAKQLGERAIDPFSQARFKPEPQYPVSFRVGCEFTSLWTLEATWGDCCYPLQQNPFRHHMSEQQILGLLMSAMAVYLRKQGMHLDTVLRGLDELDVPDETRVMMVRMANLSYPAPGDIVHEARKPRRSSFQRRLGRCYELAGRKILSGEPGYVLVHGHIRDADNPDNPGVDHAWVEHGELVWEPALDEWLPKGYFYNQFTAEPRARYTQDAVRRSILREKQWGPWDEPGDAPEPGGGEDIGEWQDAVPSPAQPLDEGTKAVSGLQKVFDSKPTRKELEKTANRLEAILVPLLTSRGYSVKVVRRIGEASVYIKVAIRKKSGLMEGYADIRISDHPWGQQITGKQEVKTSPVLVFGGLIRWELVIPFDTLRGYGITAERFLQDFPPVERDARPL